MAELHNSSGDITVNSGASWTDTHDFANGDYTVPSGQRNHDIFVVTFDGSWDLGGADFAFFTDQTTHYIASGGSGPSGTGYSFTHLQGGATEVTSIQILNGSLSGDTNVIIRGYDVQ